MGSGFFIILKHLLNIPYEQIGKRCSPIVIIALVATHISIFLSDLLDFELKFLKMPAFLGGRPGCSEVITILGMNASKLMSIVVHDDEILKFEIHEGYIVDKCISADEFSEQILGVVEVIVPF